MSELWSDWGDGEHQINSEQPAEAAGDPPADATPADASQPAADQEPAPDAEDTQQIDVPSELDQADIKECTQELQAAWGDAFDTHLQGVKTIVSQAPDYVRNFILGGRFEDGRAIGNDPGVLKWLASLAPAPSGSRQVNQSASDSNSVDAEIAAIEAKIGTREYVRSETMQARYRLLLAQRGR